MEPETVQQEEALQRLLETGALHNARVRSLKLQGETLPAISLRGSTIERLEWEDVTVEGAANFDGCVFVEKALFRKVRFQGGGLFRKAEFTNGADFTESVFGGNTHFNAAAFKRWVTFQGARFEQKAIFTRAWFPKGAHFAEARFQAGGSFNDTVSEHRFQMQRARFEGKATFSSAHFWEVTDFEGTTFEADARFKGTRFYKRVSFRETRFEGSCLLNGASLQDDGGFQGARFEGLVNMRALYGQRNVDFNAAEVGPDAAFVLQHAHFGRLLIDRAQVDGHLLSVREQDWQTARREFGLLKNSFRKVNEYRQEDWAYLMEKRTERIAWPRRSPLTALRRFADWLLLDLSCGYGTKPVNIFATSALILLGFASVYLTFSGHFDGGLSIAQAIQLSFRTFTNAEVNSAEPHPDSWLNYVLMAESFLGVFVMMVLVVTFSRKVIR